MELERLYYFMETARELHITRTAGRLHISQQTLSNHIMRLNNITAQNYFTVTRLYSSRRREKKF